MDTILEHTKNYQNWKKNNYDLDTRKNYPKKI